jgi:hypothetical protein
VSIPPSRVSNSPVTRVHVPHRRVRSTRGTSRWRCSCESDTSDLRADTPGSGVRHIGCGYRHTRQPFRFPFRASRNTRQACRIPRLHVPMRPSVGSGTRSPVSMLPSGVPGSLTSRLRRSANLPDAVLPVRTLDCGAQRRFGKLPITSTCASGRVFAIQSAASHTPRNAPIASSPEFR